MRPYNGYGTATLLAVGSRPRSRGASRARRSPSALRRTAASSRA